VNQGEIWLLETPGAKSRPALVVTRPQALGVLKRVTVALVTSTIRNGPTHLRLGADEGLGRECVANFDDLSVVDRGMLTRRLGSLGPRQRELCSVLQALADC